MQNISISFEDSHITAEKLANLLEITGFGSASSYLAIPNFRSKYLCPTVTAAFAIEQTTHRLVGLVRVLTDNMFTTYVAEVCVHPAYQKKGIGSNLIKAITERFGHTAIFADVFRDHLSIFTKNAITPKEKLATCSRRADLQEK
ncbi:MAG: GCN5-related N-acetyltransferase [Herbaspirillum sp.]|nr:GCN5-related N-acetyltransferase [Herbaspirillum sp.]